jgi:hypothetical protein
METLAECLWKQRIEVMNRQIDRLKLRIEQQAINVKELTDHPSEARKARVTLQRCVAELSLLRQQRLNLYHRLAFVDGAWPGAT